MCKEGRNSVALKTIRCEFVADLLQVGREGPFLLPVTDGVLQLVDSLTGKSCEAGYFLVGNSSFGEHIYKDGTCIHRFFPIRVKYIFLAGYPLYRFHCPIVETNNF